MTETNIRALDSLPGSIGVSLCQTATKAVIHRPMTKVTVRIDDPELSNELESAESKSELIRQALREYQTDSQQSATNLTEQEQTALRWIRKNISESMALSLLCSQLAQQLSVNRKYIRTQIIPTLNSRDLIATSQSMHAVRVSVPDTHPPAGEGETE
jgi:Arc/MetJ-type ribon-helix-helix transcriptional regulator